MGEFKTINNNYSLKEYQLENKLVKNISIVEEGMTLVKQQCLVSGGRIDILARDKNNKLCIIELKTKSDDERIIAQCMYYPMKFHEKARVITIAPSYSQMIEELLEKLNVEMKIYLNKDNKLIIKDNPKIATRIKFIRRMGKKMKKYFENGLVDMSDLGLVMLLSSFMRVEDNALVWNGKPLSQKDIINLTKWDRKRVYKKLNKLIHNDIIKTKPQEKDKRFLQYYINPEFFSEYVDE